MGEFGKHVQSLRRARGMTVRALADAVGKTAGYFSRVEGRGEIPSPELICAISDVLKEKPERLFKLAKADLLQRTEEQIERKTSEALSLHRRAKQ